MFDQPQLRVELDELFKSRDRSNMQLTIEKLLKLDSENPNNAHVSYELGGAYDTGGFEELALQQYQKALEIGLTGHWRRQCFLQMASTLRNLKRYDESLRVFDQGLREFPESVSLVLFRSLTLHAMGKVNASLGIVFELFVREITSDEILRYEAAILGNAEYLKGLDL
jgi:tetratricopeptide (TPR) repeat protein